MLVAEKNRLKAPRTACVKESIQFLIDMLKLKLDAITEEINLLIANDSDYSLDEVINFTAA